MQHKGALEVEGLRKSYGRIEALRPLELSIPAGSVFALLGSNGAGKTTFMKSVLGLVRPDGGSAVILGIDSRLPASRRSARYLPETIRFSNWATPEMTHRQLCRVRGSGTPGELEESAAAMGCSDLVGRTFGRMSHGQVQRTAISLVMAGSPDIIFLDEPSNGLDPEGRIMLRNLIRSRASGGATTILNSHLLGEVEAVCDRAAFMQDGGIAASGRIDDLLRYKGMTRIETADAQAVSAILAGLGFSPSTSGSAVSVPVAGEDDFRRIASALSSSTAHFTAVELVRENLEDLFLRLVAPGGGS